MGNGKEKKKRKETRQECVMEENYSENKASSFHGLTHIWVVDWPGVMVTMVSCLLLADTAVILIKQPFQLPSAIIWIKQPVKQLGAITSLKWQAMSRRAFCPSYFQKQGQQVQKGSIHDTAEDCLNPSLRISFLKNKLLLKHL